MKFTFPINRLRVIVAMLLVAAMFAEAIADDATPPDSSANSLLRGNSALLFELTEDFQLSSFDGLSVSIKHMTSNSRAYRLGIALSAKIDNAPADDDEYSVDLVLQRLHHIAASRPVSPFWGVGPIAGRTYAKDSTEWRAGVLFSFGAEWFPTKRVSVLGEYTTSLLYRSKNIKTYTDFYDDDGHYSTIPPHRIRTLEFSPDAVRLGLSFYW